jgi:hypothetical protein
MTKPEFEALLGVLVERLTRDIQGDPGYREARTFENRVRAVLQELSGPDVRVDLAPHPHVFPDIVVGEFGIEVKVTNKDAWRSVANSIFEGTRDPAVQHIYILFAKTGGEPQVRWGRYAECVMHVRTSHVPRFEVEIGAEASLFQQFGIAYDEFRILPTEQKMHYIRTYARGRLKEGERLWWLEEKPEEAQDHSLPLEVRLYMGLPQEEKRRLRAEAALLCPQIVKPSRSKQKYDDVALYLITYHGVLCSQARDLFSAGSVAHRQSKQRGGNYVLRALKDIEKEMRKAAEELDDALFQEYWGAPVQPKQRIKEWLKRADKLAIGWTPSKHLFK